MLTMRQLLKRVGSNTEETKQVINALSEMVKEGKSLELLNCLDAISKKKVSKKKVAKKVTKKTKKKVAKKKVAKKTKKAIRKRPVKKMEDPIEANTAAPTTVQ